MVGRASLRRGAAVSPRLVEVRRGEAGRVPAVRSRLVLSGHVRPGLGKAGWRWCPPWAPSPLAGRGVAWSGAASSGKRGGHGMACAVWVRPGEVRLVVAVPAGRVKAWTAVVGQGAAVMSRRGVPRCVGSGQVAAVMAGLVQSSRQGVPRHVEAVPAGCVMERCGEAWRGEAGMACRAKSCPVALWRGRRVTVGRGRARLASARQGAAWRGSHGMARLVLVRLGTSCRGSDVPSWIGMERYGRAGRGRQVPSCIGAVR